MLVSLEGDACESQKVATAIDRDKAVAGYR